MGEMLRRPKRYLSKISCHFRRWMSRGEGHTIPGRELDGVRAENARLRRLLDISEHESRAAREAQPELALHPVGPVTSRSPSENTKVAFYQSLFRAQSQHLRPALAVPQGWEFGLVPAVAGGWRKWMDRENADYLRLTLAAIEAHLRGSEHLGSYPLTSNDGRLFCVVVSPFFFALLTPWPRPKAARHVPPPAALEISQSGRGAHVWIFFTQEAHRPADARALASGLLAEAMNIRGSMSRPKPYDRLFPSQDRHTGPPGNLIAAPLNGKRRQHGATLFLRPGNLRAKCSGPTSPRWAGPPADPRPDGPPMLPAPVTGAKTRFLGATATKIVPRGRPRWSTPRSAPASRARAADDLGPAMGAP